jgi:hypothetical protein
VNILQRNLNNQEEKMKIHTMVLTAAQRLLSLDCSTALGKAKAQFDRQIYAQWYAASTTNQKKAREKVAGSTRGAHIDFQVSVTGDFLHLYTR